MLRTASNIRNLWKSSQFLVGHPQRLLGVGLGLSETYPAAAAATQRCLHFSDYSELKKPSPADGIFELKTCRLKPECVGKISSPFT